MKKVYVLISLIILSIPLLAQWQTEDVQITDTRGNSMTGWWGGWNIAADDEYVHIAWTDFTGTQRVRYVRFPIDTPPAPGPGIKVNEYGYGFNNTIAVDGINAHVIWDGGARQFDGSEWSESWQGHSYAAAVDDPQGNTHCVFTGAYGSGVGYTVYNWGGGSYSTTSPPGFPDGCYYPSLSLTSDGLVHVTTVAKYYPNFVYYKYSDELGWSESAPIASDAYPYTGTSICADNQDNLFVAYRSAIAPYNIFVVSRIDDNWMAEPEMVSSGEGFEHNYPSIACDPSGNVWVFWCEYRRTTNYKFEVFYNRRDANSGIWDGPQQLTASDDWDSYWVQVASDWIGGIHVCWSDDRNDNVNLPEIYYNWHGGGSGPAGLDLAMAQILRPGAQEYPGIPFTPACKVWNNRDFQVTADISCDIVHLGTGIRVYADELLDYPLEPGYNTIDEFESFTPQEGAEYEAYFEVNNPSDVNPNNNYKYQRFTTDRTIDITPYEVVRPRPIEDTIFSPEVWFAERSGLELPDINLLCSIIEVKDSILIYKDSLIQGFEPNDSLEVIFAPVYFLVPGVNYMVSFWAADSTGQKISHPPLSQFFRFQGVSISEEIARRYDLRITTANPVVENASLLFSVAAYTEVDIKMYDASGRLVKTIASDRYPPGIHPLTLTTTDVPSGVYFIRMQTPVYTTGRKMVVLH